MKRIFAWGMVAGLALVGCDDGAPSVDAGAPFDAGPRASGPDAGPPACVDNDGDGYGEGCALGLDCDDTAGSTNPGATESCNGVDDDCDSMTDEDIGAPSCMLTEGVCAGAVQRCGPDGFVMCEATDYGADFEMDETACDGLDNDCDGTTDEGCACADGATQACGSMIGACMQGTQTCADSMWGPCVGETGPMGEVCDGLDNDCDGTADDPTDLTPPACPLQLGVCAGSTRTCGGAAGWVACSGTASYGGDYQAVETLCDGLDNDCDGATDVGCTCIDGTMQTCGSAVGECVQGTQTCVAGAYGACVGEVSPATETCDGLDNDCDGATDESLAAPACALTLGVCAGATQMCTGAGGFAACTPASYGASYEVNETACDGRDNDCDGTTDEGCPCIVGAIQACGIATGACSRGTQTCSAAGWGPCTGGVDPVPETCNGIDDDCNGVSDDGLTPPPCALTAGLCAGSTQTCGGAAGWIACSGTASYGPRYVMTEDGSMDEALCDGLDNDCNGTDDDMCNSGPLVTGPEDAVVPAIYNRNLAYSVRRGGNWEIVFQNLDRGAPRQITTNSVDDLNVRLSGDRMVFIRGTGTAARAVLYDLTTDTETVLSAGESQRASIAGAFAAWEEMVGGQWDVIVRDLEAGTNVNLGTPTADELSPTIRGGRLAYVSFSAGTQLVNVVELDGVTGLWGAPVTQVPSGTATIHVEPYVDFVGIGWSDGSRIAGMPSVTSEWDAYWAPFGTLTGASTWPADNVLANATGAELVRGVDSQIYVLDDFTAGDWNVSTGLLGGTTVPITTSTASQAAISNSGGHLVWHDNRLGGFDIYQSFYGGGVFRPGVGTVLVAEVLADPAAGADPNGDGTASTTQDELIELVNVAGQAVALDGLTLSDATGVRHTFPPGTWLPAFGVMVVFGGGTPAGTFAGAQVQVASSGALGLNNTGDTITLSDGATVIDTVTYGSEGGMDQSILRDGAMFVLHSTVGTGADYSPGTFADGFVP